MDAGDAALAADAAAPDPRSALVAAGFMVQDGAFEALDLSDCCSAGMSCVGNNPTSPYFVPFLPRAPGQTVANYRERGDGLGAAVRMRADEAFVMIGRTPPTAAYFGFTPYLLDRDYGGTRRTPFASLAETLNNRTIRVDVPAGSPSFDQPFAWIAAADATIEARARAALVAAGVPAAAISLIPIDPAVVRFGTTDAADTVGVLFRVALFEDPAAGMRYLAAPGATVLRLTPTSMGTPDPLASPTPRPKDSSSNEDLLAPAVMRLHDAILAANPGLTVVRDVVANDGDQFVPADCIAAGSPCLGDNRDTVYPVTMPFLFGPNDVIFVYGVDHQATGRATYASASIYEAAHQAGIAAVTSHEWAGSAARFLPSDPDVSRLFAWRFARTCGADPMCLPISADTCPDGVGVGEATFVAFRAYVEPTSFTAAPPATMVNERVLVLRP